MAEMSKNGTASVDHQNISYDHLKDDIMISNVKKELTTPEKLDGHGFLTLTTERLPSPELVKTQVQLLLAESLNAHLIQETNRNIDELVKNFEMERTLQMHTNDILKQRLAAETLLKNEWQTCYTFLARKTDGIDNQCTVLARENHRLDNQVTQLAMNNMKLRGDRSDAERDLKKLQRVHNECKQADEDLEIMIRGERKTQKKLVEELETQIHELRIENRHAKFARAEEIQCHRCIENASAVGETNPQGSKNQECESQPAKTPVIPDEDGPEELLIDLSDD